MERKVDNRGPVEKAESALRVLSKDSLYWEVLNDLLNMIKKGTPYTPYFRSQSYIISRDFILMGALLAILLEVM